MATATYSDLLIFIADDDEDDRDFLCTSLMRYINSSQVIQFKNGKELLNEVNEVAHRPNLILLDLNMPIMDGFEALTRMRKVWNSEQLPVIILSTTGNKDHVTKCYNLGANDYIVKPFSVSEYDSIVENLISGLVKNAKAAL